MLGAAAVMVWRVPGPEQGLLWTFLSMGALQQAGDLGLTQALLQTANYHAARGDAARVEGFWRFSLRMEAVLFPLAAVLTYAAGLAVFAVLLFWQIPHFHSLAWLYRKDYARAGFRMLSVIDEDGSRTRSQILLCCVALIPASLGLTVVGTTGFVYLVFASLFGALFLGCGILFAKSSSPQSTLENARANLYARRMFSASLLYLPALLIVISIDKM